MSTTFLMNSSELNPASRREAGATAVLVAASLLLLIGIAAIAIDYGNGLNQRRQAQAAADFGVLAALQFADYTIPAVQCAGLAETNTAQKRAKSACRGAVEATAVVAGTFGPAYTAAQWLACTDPDAFSEVASTISPCISFSANLRMARVRLPTRSVPAVFSRVIGASSLDVRAVAEAGEFTLQSANVLPFAIGPVAATSSQACLFANPGTNTNPPSLAAYPCNGAAQGNFGLADIAQYGDDTKATPLRCTGATQDRLAMNIILGADHPLVIHQDGDPVVNDISECPNANPDPNQIDTQTGNSAQGLDKGLLEAITDTNGNSQEGRVRCKGESVGTPPISTPCTASKPWVGLAEVLDDTPLWSFIDYTAALPTSCKPATIIAAGDGSRRQMMEACITAWKGLEEEDRQANPLFKPQIEFATRFAAVPLLEDNPSNGSSQYLIKEFLPIYLETLYVQCTSSTCDYVFSPGEGTPAVSCPSPLNMATNCGWPILNPGNRSTTAMSSFMLTKLMLPLDLRDRFPSSINALSKSLIK